jgi:hypothetical protein
VSARRFAAALAIAALLAPAAAFADDKTRAAEHFARAQSAETREDWRGAIAEYEAAYALSPHPSVLYNMALAYERLQEFRAAARQFLRYLDKAPSADDREEVLARVRALRLRPSQVSFDSRPPGARIVVDGVERGRAPLTLTLDSGSTYRVVAEDAGRRSPVQTVAPEYGDRLAVTLELNSQPGFLLVDSNVAGAEVALDGVPIGRTPLSVPVAAGPHRVAIRLAGYRPVERRVDVPAQGSEQVRAALEPLAGGPPPPFASPEPPDSHFLLATSYGFHPGSGDDLRYALSLGYRFGFAEASALLGTFGGFTGVGGELRVFLVKSRLRPYLRGGALYGTTGSDGSTTAIEGGAGILWSMQPPGRVSFSLDYFVEISAQYRIEDETVMPETDEEEDEIRVPLVFGIAFRLGG